MLRKLKGAVTRRKKRNSLTEAPKDNGQSQALRTAKGSLILALEVAEKAVDGIIIPGVKGSIGVVLAVIKGIDATKSNTETLALLEKHVKYLSHDALEPLSGMAESDIPPSLKTHIQELASELGDLAKVWTTRSSRGGVRRFVDAKSDEGDLRQFADNIRLAVERFQTSEIIEGRLAHARQERGISRIEAHIESEAMNKLSNLVNELPRAKTASHDSGRAGGPSSCFVGTRITILDTIKSWIQNPDSTQPRIFWLNGLAGVGKSTIAQTIAEFAHERKLLGGSFFFSRDVGSLSNPGLVFPTLAYQLAQFDPAFKRFIGEALREDPDYGHRAALKQLEKLIIGPLVASGPSQRVVLLVLDALDECRPDREAAELLRLLLAHATRVPFSFRIFLTSRPEYRIRTVFDQEHNHTKFILHDIEASIVRSDIRLFVRGGLDDIPKQLNIRVAPGWPKETDLEALVEKSGKLFVYAATALRFIGNDHVLNPQKQMEILLGARQATRAKPYADLDLLYLQVLRSALLDDTEDDDIVRFQKVVGNIVLLRDPLSLDALARFTGYDIEEVSTAIFHLHSIILPPPSHDEAPRLYHPSFHDFITNPQRCNEPRFTIIVPTHEKRLVQRCLEVMIGSLKRDIVGVGDPSWLNREIEDLEKKIKDTFSPELLYSCRYWATHLKEAPCDADVVQQLELFLSRYLLNWFEAMSLFNTTPLAVSYMRDIHQWAVQSNCDTHVTAMLYDGYRFILHHQLAIANSALQVYQTALAYTPSETWIYRNYEKEARDTIRVLHGTPRRWSPCLSTIQGIGSGFRSIAYSRDGSRMVAGANSNKVGVWDGVSGAHIMTFDHPGSIDSVCFLGDYTHFASASSEKDIKLWDITTGTEIMTLKGHSDAINCISMSPVESHLASASSDATIRIWDTTSGACISTFQCHSSPVFAIVFLPDGSQLLSGSEDCVVRLWDTTSGAELKTFEGHFEAIRSIDVSPDGLRFASGSDDRSVKIFDIASDGPPLTLNGHQNSVTTVAFSPTGSRLASSGTDERHLRVWNSSSGEIVTTFYGYAPGIAFTPDEKWVVSASRDSTCRLWDTTSPPADIDPEDHTDWVCSVVFSVDGSHLATGGNETDRSVRLWDAILGKHLKTLRGHSWGIYSLTFSPNGLRLASGSGDCTVRLWDVNSGELILVLPDHESWVKGIDFIGDGSIVTRTDHETSTWDLSKPDQPVLRVNEENPTEPSGIGGESKGYYLWMDGDRWLWIASERHGEEMRVSLMLEEYRIGGFAVHSDRVVFVCVGSQVLILDVSQLKKKFGR